MHVRSSRVGILDSVTRQHTAMNHSKSYEAFKKIVQEPANNSTTGQEAMHIGRIEAGATAPTTAWPPWVAETSEDSWQECDAINAMGSQQCSTCKGHGHVPSDCPKGKGKCKGQHNFGEDKGPYEWSKSNYDGNKGSNDAIYILSSHGPVKEFQQGDGKSGGQGPRHGKSYTCGGDHFARDCPKVEEKED